MKDFLEKLKPDAKVYELIKDFFDNILVKSKEKENNLNAFLDNAINIIKNTNYKDKKEFEYSKSIIESTLDYISKDGKVLDTVTDELKRDQVEEKVQEFGKLVLEVEKENDVVFESLHDQQTKALISMLYDSNLNVTDFDKLLNALNKDANSNLGNGTNLEDLLKALGITTVPQAQTNPQMQQQPQSNGNTNSAQSYPQSGGGNQLPQSGNTMGFDPAKYSAAIQSYISDIDNLENKIDQTYNDLSTKISSGDWQGPASETFNSKIANWDASAVNIKSCLENSKNHAIVVGDDLMNL